MEFINEKQLETRHIPSILQPRGHLLDIPSIPAQSPPLLRLSRDASALKNLKNCFPGKKETEEIRKDFDVKSKNG